MIPLHDAIPIRTRPVATWILLAALGVLAAVPDLRVTPSAFSMPASGPAAVGTRLLHELITHRDWIQLVTNALAIWIFGPVLEDRMGHGRFAAFVSVCAVTGAAAAATVPQPTGALVGFSGLSAGLATAYSIQFPISRIVVPIPVLIGFELADVPAWLLTAFWTAMQLVDLVPPRALLAGAAAGAIGLVLARRRERLHPDWWSPKAGIRE